MKQIQETMESDSDCSEYLKNNKDELVETIAVESDLDLDEDREMIERTVENMYLHEKFSGKESSTELEPSPIEDVKSTLFTPTPSQGVAKVTNVVEVRDGVLELTFSVRGVENEFTKKFYHNNYERNAISDVESREDLERVYKLAGTDISNPTDIIGNTVPVKPGSRGNAINYPPSDPGIGRRIAHHSLRKLRKYDLIGYNSDNTDFRTKINNRFYIILSLFTVPFLTIPSNILTVSIFSVICIVWVIVLIYQVLYSAVR